MKAKPRIPAVDDNATNLSIIEEILTDEYGLEKASGGVAGLRAAESFLPDIILLDIMMPDLNGYEVCRRIRANPALHHTKVIMVSAKAVVSERLRGYDCGADDDITKPFEEEELLAQLRVYLRLKSVEEVDQLKSDVFALLNHETRTPLNGILSPTELFLADGDLPAGERIRLARLIHESATRPHDLFEKVIQLSAMKSGSYRFSFETGDVGEVLTEVTAALSAAAARQILLVPAFAHTRPCPLDGDEIGAEQHHPPQSGRRAGRGGLRR